MSRENVEIAKSYWDAWEEGGTDALFRFYDPNVVWDMTQVQTLELSAVYQGHDEVRDFLGAWIGAFDDLYAHADEFTDAGDAVVVTLRQGGRGKETGVEVAMTLWHLYRFHDGLIIEVTPYATRAEAFEAVGLPE